MKPSNADQDLTNKIQMGAKYLDIMVLDHIILSADGYNSFADEGLLWSYLPGTIVCKLYNN